MNEIKLINYFEARAAKCPKSGLLKEPRDIGIYFCKENKPYHLIGVLTKKDYEKIRNFSSDFILNLNKILQICLENKEDNRDLLKLFIGNYQIN